jgi:hypothetical protein
MSEPERSIVILPSVIRLLGTCSGNLKEEARSLTPPGCCMWVAPLLQARNLLLRHGEEEETKQRTGSRRVLLEDNEHKRRQVRQSGPSRRIRHEKVKEMAKPRVVAFAKPQVSPLFRPEVLIVENDVEK